MKLKIEAFTAPQFTGSAGEYTVQINPDTLRHSRTLQINNSDATSTAAPSYEFKGYGDNSLSFSITFDGTGIIEDAANRTVEQMVGDLDAVIFNFNGDIHRPNYLKVSWGNLIFKGQLSSYTLSYSLFKSDGTAIRAKADLTIIGFVDAETRERRANRSSPDLSHVKTVRAGDHLPLLCREIYRDMGYYIQVAEINGLTNFRKLTPGDQLLFLPLSK
ncbi:MAG: LysM peptidoglycan-binding domain-containing protein [Bacteroidia bacterium]|nr:LysM peptidoglycan-binding domain-containing protein [Bacteroidia bacterium]